MTALTRDDIIKYIIKIQLNFENAFKATTDLDKSLLIESWFEILGEYPKEICDRAVVNALKKAKFAPRIGDIVDEINALYNAQKKSDEQLWAELMDVCPKVYEISRYLKYEQYYKNASEKLRKIYEGLSDDLKLYVVNLSTLIDISELTDDDLPFEKTRFFKQMPGLRQQSDRVREAKKFFASIDAPKRIGKSERK